MIRKNSPELWDSVWEAEPPPGADRYALRREECGIRWQRIEQRVMEHLGGFKDLKVIEIGAGAGINAALFSVRGARVTVLDYSQNALRRSRNFFERNDLQASFILEDALSLSANHLNRYDVSMSFGLAEHFRNTERLGIIQSHFNLLNGGGMTFISVPNHFNLPYQLYKFAARLLGRWNVGEEYAFSRRELKTMCRILGINRYSFFGDSFPGSFHLINPMNMVRNKGDLQGKYDLSRLKKERGSFLDAHCSYALVLCGYSPGS